MLVLVINSGSSSIKSAVIDTETEETLLSVRVLGIGERETVLCVDQRETRLTDCDDHESAMRCILLQVQDHCRDISAVGHRMVHGGAEFVHPTVITDQVLSNLQSLTSLAPLHNPGCLEGIHASRQLLPKLMHVVVFDTAFHATLPRRSQAYALPRHIVEAQGIRRFGFHGISHQYMSEQAAKLLKVKIQSLRLITCHLGNGCSVAAVEFGRSIDTTMGMTPLEGLVMGTRSGDVDPGVLLKLMHDGGLSASDLDDLLNRRSGLYGMTGTSNMREVEMLAAQGDDYAQQAIQVFCHRVRKAIGGYAALMGGVDAIVVAGGIGEKSALIRHRIAQRLEFLGATLDEEENRSMQLDSHNPIAVFSRARARTPLIAVATNEELVIARETAEVIQRKKALQPGALVPIAISARHVHLSRAGLDKLFGVGYQLRVDHELSQPGQFAAIETVTLQGPSRAIEHVRVLGPLRDQDQVEISRSDEFTLGVDAPVRASGDLANTPGITLIGPEGQLHLNRGLICAWRHIHMTPSDAGRWGVSDGDVVSISTKAMHRTLDFREVLIRVSPNFRLEMHIDTDEANAAGLESHATGVLQPTSEPVLVQAASRRSQ